MFFIAHGAALVEHSLSNKCQSCIVTPCWTKIHLNLCAHQKHVVFQDYWEIQYNMCGATEYNLYPSIDTNYFNVPWNGEIKASDKKYKLIDSLIIKNNRELQLSTKLTWFVGKKNAQCSELVWQWSSKNKDRVQQLCESSISRRMPHQPRVKPRSVLRGGGMLQNVHCKMAGITGWHAKMVLAVEKVRQGERQRHRGFFWE